MRGICSIFRNTIRDRTKNSPTTKFSPSTFSPLAGWESPNYFTAIKSQRELTPKFLYALPESFVVKPSRGYGGGGILVIERRRGANFLSVSGDSISRESLFQHCVGILEGRYSISGVSDQVIFEERLLCQPRFSGFIGNGVAGRASNRVPKRARNGNGANPDAGIGRQSQYGNGRRRARNRYWKWQNDGGSTFFEVFEKNAKWGIHNWVSNSVLGRNFGHLHAHANDN